MENKELELLREYFDKADSYFVDEKLKEQILEIQKKNKLNEKIKFLKSRIDFESETIFNQILKQLGYEC